MLLGIAAGLGEGAPKLLFIKARIDDHHGEASAPAQGPMVLGAVARKLGWDARCIDTTSSTIRRRRCAKRSRVFPRR